MKFRESTFTVTFPLHFDGITCPSPGSEIDQKRQLFVKSNSGEMANAMYLAGFDVKDVHMTDLISGRETLEDIQFIGAVGGFSNSDVLGSAKGWAGAFKYNEKSKYSFENFFKEKIRYRLEFVMVASCLWNWKSIQNIKFMGKCCTTTVKKTRNILHQ
jgi:phosphoribosylformylglycinamidine synthase